MLLSDGGDTVGDAAAAAVAAATAIQKMSSRMSDSFTYILYMLRAHAYL